MFKGYKFIDLTHTLNVNTPTWSGHCGFHHYLKADYDEASLGVKFRTHQIEMDEGIGTHIDSPSHCFSGSTSVDKIPLEGLITHAIMINLSHKTYAEYIVSFEDIKEFEAKYSPIQPKTFVIIYTGWDKYWPTKAYHNDLQFPSISKEAAEYLVKKDIAGIGIDTLSPDIHSSGFPVHEVLLKSGKYIIENIANAASLPPSGFYTIALPLKIEEGAESPIRLVGIVPER
ncbi:MAG: putative cyclase [Rickettsiaceae bacterium]|jgi:kynurenine formamidase|nr:putative cyclase [Rickettsiaceae bacterium]